MFRAEQALFFTVPEGKQDRPLGSLGQFAEGLDHLQHRGHAAGIIVGSVMNQSDRAVTVAPAAVAHVVVMSTDDQHILFELRIAALEQPEDVAVSRTEGLVIRPLGAAAGNAGCFELFDEIQARGPAASAAGLASFERVVGQHADMFAHPLERNGRAGDVDRRVLGPGRHQQ